MEQKDHDLCERLAHTLKGVSGTIGAQELYGLLRSLEKAFQDEDTKIAEALLPRVQGALEQVLGSITSLEPHPSESLLRVINPTDISTLKPEQERLKELLEDDDLEAVKVLDRLYGLLSASELDASLIEEIKESVSSYDFEEALDQLATLTAAVSS
ncbi:MAG: Hpt domain-containing protein [Magnetococcales bacterium]|nr:Hpt domain-containing protein [Magnetococcales bacterium]